MPLNADQARTRTLLTETLHAVQKQDPETMQAIAASDAPALAGQDADQRRRTVMADLQSGLSAMDNEPDPGPELYHSRNPLVGLFQSLAQSFQDQAVPQIQAYGDGNPIAWLPTGIRMVLDNYRPKVPFVAATEAKSLHTLPDHCRVALLSDWGADNEHAYRIGQLAAAHAPDLVIHMGDIYYSGTDDECRTFLQNWPLRDAAGAPKAGSSFALNGNHEMYSCGHGYFTLVLPAFAQEASYFTLANEQWQVHGLDTAYVPFSISGGGRDARLMAQWNWLVARMHAAPGARNILLTHNQPLSAHKAEFEAGGPLREEYYRLTAQTSTDAVFAWFFGHEHRCTIYDDTATHFKARLVGNGAIPHPPQTEVAAQLDDGSSCTKPWRVNHGSLSAVMAISSFCLLTFDGPECVAEYINEDGSLFYREQLSGAANDALGPQEAPASLTVTT